MAPGGLSTTTVIALVATNSLCGWGTDVSTTETPWGNYEPISINYAVYDKPPKPRTIPPAPVALLSSRRPTPPPVRPSSQFKPPIRIDGRGWV